MLIKKIVPFVILLASATLTVAQDPSSQAPTSQTATAQASPDPQQQQEEKAKLEKKATALLEQVVTEGQALKLPENRIRVEIAAGDMLWDRNPARARGLLSDAAALLGQMMLDADRTDRQDMQNVNQLRQDLVLTAGRHDAELGYQLLRSTQTQPNDNVQTNGRRANLEAQNANLEQNLLATIAATDPKVAYQKAVESLDKGEYSNALARVLAQLQAKDQDNFKKLSDKVLNRLGSENLLATRGAASLALTLLSPGPLVASTTGQTETTGQTQTTSQPQSASSNTNTRNNTAQVLNESAYHDLMDNAVTAALSLTATASTNNARGGPGGGRGQLLRGPQQNQPTQPDEAQTRQNNARMILMGLQGVLPQLDQYLPERSQAVRQKLTEIGMGNNPNLALMNQMRAAMQPGNTSESLVTMASTAPPQIQPRLYQQAAQRAIDEGNTDRAVQIATDHLDESQRNSIMQAVDFKKLTMTASADKLDEIKQKLAKLPSDSDRVKYLIELSSATQKDNPKLALRFLDDARNLVNKRVTSYKQFEDQLKVAEAFATVDPKRSFEVLEPGIAHLNELLNAAQVLNGFEVEIFKEGEMSLRNDSDLISMVNRFGQELASLSKVDFDHARLTADQFQFSEPRLNAKLQIVQSVLAPQRQPGDNNNRRFQNFQFVAR
jgi:hypothetical protein